MTREIEEIESKGVLIVILFGEVLLSFEFRRSLEYGKTYLGAKLKATKLTGV